MSGRFLRRTGELGEGRTRSERRRPTGRRIAGAVRTVRARYPVLTSLLVVEFVLLALAAAIVVAPPPESYTLSRGVYAWWVLLVGWAVLIAVGSAVVFVTRIWTRRARKRREARYRRKRAERDRLYRQQRAERPGLLER